LTKSKEVSAKSKEASEALAPNGVISVKVPSFHKDTPCIFNAIYA